MRNAIKCILSIALVLAGYGCKSDRENLQEQLDDEFGEYTEEVTSENRTYYAAYDKALKLWDTSYGEVNIKTSFGDAHVLVSGPEDGEPVVLLHGMNASSTMWYPNIKALSQCHRVYAIDYLMEPGKSELNGEVENMTQIMNWYNEVFSGLKLKKFSLIGASKGGWLAVYIALRQKSQIKKLILLSPAQTFTRIRPGFDMLTNIGYTLNPKRKNLRKALETMSANVDKIEQAYIDQYFLSSERASLSKFILQMTTYSNDELRTLTMPVLTLIGDEDIINVEKTIEKAKELLPQAEVGVIKNAGHFLSFDQPEAVNKRMLGFLKANNSSN